MVIVDSLDERLLDCAFCGNKFFDTPDMALFGWDDDTPIYACMACDAAQPLRAVDAAMPPSAEPLSGSNIVPAVESDTQPRP